jgi:tRNA pseudouridine38-40 synthase
LKNKISLVPRVPVVPGIGKELEELQERAVVRYQAVVEYDGTDFLGFQRQAQGRTVQGEIESALQRIGWPGQSILGAGRTDTGVHAAGQVIAFDLDWPHGDDSLVRALNANLPADIAVKTIALAPPGFHPRFRAIARRYRYTIYNAPTRSALAARYSWHVWSRLDVNALQAAAQVLIGTHDFATFGTDPDDGPNGRPGNNTVRTISRAEWMAAREWLYFDIQADAFLYRMVRSVVAALRLVGAGGRAVADFQTLLEARDRAQCPPIAPPQGLCLMEVIF